LAPKGYVSTIDLKQTLPDAFYLRKSVAFSASSTQENQTEAPIIHHDHVTKGIDLEFKTTITGRCVGNLVVGLGVHRLYNIGLSVFVNKESGLVLYHPAARDSTSVALAGSKSTFIILSNRTAMDRTIDLSSSCSNDRLEPQSMHIRGFASVVIKVTFGDCWTRRISCEGAKLELRKVTRVPHFEGTKFVVDDGAFLRCCIVQPGRRREICFMKTRVFSSAELPVIITESAELRPLAYYRVQSHVSTRPQVRIGLDPSLGLTEYELSETPPEEVLILWGEDRCSSPPVFVPQIKVSETQLSLALDEIRKVRGRVAQSESVSTLIFKAANDLLSLPCRIQQVSASTLLTKTKPD
jgi:hypothetical protein